MIREITANDYKQILPILQEIQDSGDSYFFENMNDTELLAYWSKPNFTGFIKEIDNKIAGSYILGPISQGRFRHICNASYIVNKDFRGHKIATELCNHSLNFAKQIGYKGIQFNQVVSTNLAAVKTWTNLGFSIIGIVPQAFIHKTLGMVDAYIFFNSLVT